MSRRLWRRVQGACIRAKETEREHKAAMNELLYLMSADDAAADQITSAALWATIAGRQALRCRAEADQLLELYTAAQQERMEYLESLPIRERTEAWTHAELGKLFRATITYDTICALGLRKDNIWPLTSVSHSALRSIGFNTMRRRSLLRTVEYTLSSQELAEKIIASFIEGDE